MAAAPSSWKRLQAHVSGRVQGVCFRAWTCEQAQDLALVGWVRNLSDGRVEFLAEGPESDLRTLLERSHQGPPAARVTEVIETWSAALGQFEDFKIRYDRN